MEENSGTRCSKTSESEENDESSSKININGSGAASSSNSTVEENDQKKPSVRPYVRSKMPRLRWTPDLHLRFVHAVERLGGQDRATPKLVLQLMNIKGLSIAHVKSHLQMHRSKKIDDQGQAISEHRHLVESGDPNIYNLSQLPMLHGYNHHHHNHNRHQGDSSNTFRYGDGSSWNGGREFLMRNPYTSRNFIDGFKMGTSPFNSFPVWKSHEFMKNESSTTSHINLHAQPKLGQIDQLNPIKSQTQPKVEDDQYHSKLKWMKRKTSDCDIDLDLSLRPALTQEMNEETQKCFSKEDDVGSELSLSLYSSSSSSSLKLSRLKGEDDSKESARRVSTLDLTI